MILNFVLEYPLTTLLLSCIPFVVIAIFTIKTKSTRSGVIGTILAIPAALGGLWMGNHLDNPDYFPNDVYWYEGKVQDVKKSLDGDINIFFEDGSWIVSVIHAPTNIGDTRYLLHASNTNGSVERTFDCIEKDREKCGHLSLAIKAVFDTNTMNQGPVKASIEAKNT